MDFNWLRYACIFKISWLLCETTHFKPSSARVADIEQEKYVIYKIVLFNQAKIYFFGWEHFTANKYSGNDERNVRRQGKSYPARKYV